MLSNHTFIVDKEIEMIFANGRACFVALTTVAGFMLTGCSSQPTANSSPESNGQPAQVSSSDRLPEGLAKSTDADRAAALQQEVCPVTGAKLGSMGMPLKINVGDQEVFLCCDGCEEQIRSEPEKYLAKLKSK
jgi:hypothetical protein